MNIRYSPAEFVLTFSSIEGASESTNTLRGMLFPFSVSLRLRTETSAPVKGSPSELTVTLPYISTMPSQTTLSLKNSPAFGLLASLKALSTLSLICFRSSSASMRLHEEIRLECFSRSCLVESVSLKLDRELKSSTLVSFILFETSPSTKGSAALLPLYRVKRAAKRNKTASRPKTGFLFMNCYLGAPAPPLPPFPP